MGNQGTVKQYDEKGERPLLGNVLYKPGGQVSPVTLNNGFQRIETNRPDPTIYTSIPLLNDQTGLRLNLKSGNLFGQYGEGKITWEIANIP